MPTDSMTPDDPQLRALFDAMPQLGWAAHPDGWIYYYNRQWYDYTGSTPEDMAGWRWQSVHNPVLLPLILKRWKHSIETEQPFEMAFQLRRHDGVFRWFLTRVTPMRDESGVLVRWVGINTDIDDQKRAEDAAAAANRAKDEFLAMLSHELRNPLAPIVTALKLMAMKDAEAFRHERNIMERQTAHMVRLVDDLLDVSRFVRGTVNIQWQPVDIAQVISDACEIVSPLTERAQHTVDITVPQGLTIAGDSARLKQVLVNLLTNAARCTPAGGRIAIIVDATASAVVLRVRDNGMGIPASLLPKLFQPFVQKTQPLARSNGGLGLGLTIVRSIVAAHGGTVTANSPGENHGSEFVVQLPVIAPAVIRQPDTVRQPPRTSKSRRVMVVDDNSDAADLIAAALEQSGHVTHVEYHAVSALSAAEVFSPEVALLDLGLPDMNGYELARRLRQHPRLRDVQIIAVTGYGASSDRERTTAAGFDHHCVKPIDLVELLMLIEPQRATPEEM